MTEEERKEKERARHKRYYETHKEECAERQRRYRATHAEHCKARDKEYKKKYREEHKDEIREYQKRYKAENKERLRKYDVKRYETRIPYFRSDELKESQKENQKRYRENNKEKLKERQTRYNCERSDNNNKSREYATHHYKGWTSDETYLLLEMVSQGKSPEYIAYNLGRTIQSVNTKLTRIRKEANN